MKFKINDIVIMKNLRHDRGCVVVEISSVIARLSNTGYIPKDGYNTKYLILDYDRMDMNGVNVKTWVDESEIDIFISEVRDRKLKELGI